MRLGLCASAAGQETVFSISPRYLMQHVGDRVRFTFQHHIQKKKYCLICRNMFQVSVGDEVVFKGALNSNFLHCNTKTFPSDGNRVEDGLQGI